MATQNSKEGRRYPLWKAWGFSLFSADLYQDVALNWKGTAYGALFLTILILSVLRGVVLPGKLSMDVPGFFRSIPPFKIEKGVFSTEAVQPYRIDYKGGAIVIDTTGRYKALTDVPGYPNLDSLYLVTATEYMDHRVRLGMPRDRVRKMFQANSFVATREDLDRWGGMVATWMGPVLTLFMFIGWSISNAVTVMLYALLGVFFTDVLKGSMDYHVALRLAVVSHFPAMIFFTALALFGLEIHWLLLWATLVSLGYLFFAVKADQGLGTNSGRATGL